MALTDINFNAGERQEFIAEIPVGTLNAPVDIVFEYTHEGLMMEIGPSYADPAALAAVIWAYSNRTLTG